MGATEEATLVTAKELVVTTHDAYEDAKDALKVAKKAAVDTKE